MFFSPSIPFNFIVNLGLGFVDGPGKILELEIFKTQTREIQRSKCTMLHLHVHPDSLV